MPKFSVYVTYKAENELEVEAENEDEAMSKAEEYMYNEYKRKGSLETDVIINAVTLLD